MGKLIFINKIVFVKGGKATNLYEIKIGNKFILLSPFLISEKTHYVEIPLETKLYVTFDEYTTIYKSNYYLVPVNLTHGMNFNGRLLLLKEACEIYNNCIKNII